MNYTKSEIETLEAFGFQIRKGDKVATFEVNQRGIHIEVRLYLEFMTLPRPKGRKDVFLGDIISGGHKAYNEVTPRTLHDMIRTLFVKLGRERHEILWQDAKAISYDEECREWVRSY